MGFLHALFPLWSRQRRRISLVFAVFSILMLVGYLVFLQINRAYVSVENILSPEQVLTILTFSFLGVLLSYRRPENPISWLFVLMGLLRHLAYLNSMISIVLVGGRSPSFGLLLAGFLSPWLTGITFSLLAFLIILFPTGRLLSPRWRWTVWLLGGQVFLTLLLAGVLTADLAAFLSGPMPPGSLLAGALRGAGPRVGFMPHVQAPPPLAERLLVPIQVILLLFLVLGMAAQTLRFRRGDGVHRQQVKWVLYALALWLFSYVTFFYLDIPPFQPLFRAMLLLSTSAVPAAITVAILRFRLYDIDLIIRRTIQYAILTGLLAAFYFLIVVLLQGILSRIAGNPDSPLITVISTLMIAALFTPLRTRVQSFIDRRFFRKKYDSERALAQFADTIRNEVDMDALSMSLLALVNETIHPEQVSLWKLKPIRRPGRKP